MIKFRNQRGATLVEYATILALISATAVGAVALVGRATNDTLSGAADQIEDAKDGALSPAGGSGDAESGGGESAGNDPMILTFNTLSGDVTLPLSGAVAATINWGGSNTSCPTTVSSAGLVTCSYDTPGTYTISIAGSVEHFGSVDPDPVSNIGYLVSVDDWGDVGLAALSFAFNGATSLSSVPSDLPSTVIKLDSAFKGSSFNGSSITSWDVSQVTDFQYMFTNATSFNQDISSWTTSSALNMEGMFSGASQFNQPIGSWDMNGVYDIAAMFDAAVNFDQDLPWDTSAVMSLYRTFGDASSFNGDISSWDVSSVEDMTQTFSGASSFNGNISSWNTLVLRYLDGTFYNASAFNQDIGGWDTSLVLSTEATFFRAYSFNQDIGAWRVGESQNMNFMFYDAENFDQDLSGWCVASFSSAPGGFDEGASSWASARPVWGTCP